MEDFEKLKSIGAKEISKNTHIAINKIQYILERNFKELKDSTTTHGLLQILEREYRIDLKEWEEEYKAFWENYDGSNDEVVPIVNFKVTHETIASSDSKRSVLLGVLLVALLGVGFFAFMNFYGDSFTSNDKDKTERRKLESKIEAYKDSTEGNNATSELEIINHLDASASTPINTPSKDIQELESKNVESQIENAEELQEATQEELVEAKKVSIVPVHNVWVGIVYLDTKRRTSFITEKAFEVDLSRPQTIITGHGMLEIDVKEGKSTFNSANKMFFIVDKNGNFTQATQGQYEAETKGLGW